MSATGELDNRVADLNLESLIQQAAEHNGHTSNAPGNMTPGNMAPELPPSIAAVKNVTAEEFLKAMNKMPLFMTELDEQGMDGGDNIDLEALRALAYEGEPDEVWFALYIPEMKQTLIGNSNRWPRTSGYKVLSPLDLCDLVPNTTFEI